MKGYWWSVDPGVQKSGWAFWFENGLQSVGYSPVDRVDGEDALVIERPQVYQGRAQKGDPNDLISLAIEVGRISTLFGEVEFVLPRKWKGTIKKEMMTARIIKTLTTNELLLVKELKLAKSYEHNVLDAIGIGLWKLGRL